MMAATHLRVVRGKAKKRREYLYAEGPAGSMKILIERAHSRLSKLLRRAKAYGLPAELMVTENLELAVGQLDKVSQGLGRVPSDWRPVRGSIRNSKFFDGGAVVVLKAVRRNAHALEFTDTHAKMVVVRVAGGKVLCEVTSGSDKGLRVVIPHTHLEES